MDIPNPILSTLKDNINPLIKNDIAKFIPFSQIKNEHFLPAINHAISLAKAQIELITSNPDLPNFDNTIKSFENSGIYFNQISSLFTHKLRTDTSSELEELSHEINSQISTYKNEIAFNTKLFNRISHVYSSQFKDTYDADDNALIEKQYKSFVRNGMLLTDNVQIQRLNEINTELSLNIAKFESNVLQETNLFYLHVTDEKDLKGLPAFAIDSAKIAREKKILTEGWVFTLDIPSYLPFITYCDNRHLRKEMALAYGSRCFKGSAFDNKDILLKILSLRNERAKILGYKSHAAYILEDRMAKDVVTVEKFLSDIMEKAKPLAVQEYDQLSKLANELDNIEIGTLQKWDISYYSEKLKKRILNFDDEAVRPYFKLENVLNGIFLLANKLYGIAFTEKFDIEKYHEDVRTFEVTQEESGEVIADFFIDYFPRKEKKSGGWVYTLIPQDENTRPYVGNITNIPMPTGTRPSLLAFHDVETLFHEFGHALHVIFSNVKYRSLSGINVLWDFLELPSQIMENWCYEPEMLSMFAFHYESGEVIPDEYLKQIKESKKFLTGLSTLRQLNFSYLDMKLHSESFPTAKEDIKQFENENTFQLWPSIEDNCFTVSFTHLFNLTYDYSAGYYSYMWAEVIDADAFEEFKSNGIFDRKTAEKFRMKVLSKGGSGHPMELYKAFKGREPSIDAFWNRKGLL